MWTITNKQMKKLTRKTAFCAALVVMAILAFASKGGGGGDKKASAFKSNFTPIRSVSTFTLKSTPAYSNSYIFNQQKENNKLSFNTMITYEKGNTVYILPYNYRVNISCSNTPKTNLQFFGVKIKMPK